MDKKRKNDIRLNFKKNFKRALIVTLLCSIFIGGKPPLKVNAKNGDIINNTNGLISAGVNDVCQTTDGFIWIAQYEGLTKFDGKYYQLINNIDIDGREVLLEQITNVEADRNNRLYIGTKNDGMIVYENGKYSSVTKENGQNVSDISIFDDTIYVATADGAYTYKNNTVTWIEDSIGNPILSITAKGADIYYVAKGGTSYHYNGQSSIFYNEKSIKTIRAFGDTVYLGSDSGTLVLANSDSKSEYLVSSNDPINELYMEQGSLLIGTDNGVFEFNNNETARIKELEKYTGINRMIFDHEGGLWIATTVGLVEIHRFGVNNLFLTCNIDEGLVNACYYYKNLLYVGMENGLIIIDEASKSTVSNNLTSTLEGVRIRDFLVVGDELYIATYSSSGLGVYVYDGNLVRNISSSDMYDDSDLSGLSSHGKIRCFAQYGDGILIGTNYGITLLLNNEYKTIKLKYRPLSIMVGKDKIYVCTDGDGIYTVDFDTKTSTSISQTSGKTILRVIEYNNGLLYAIGTCLYYLENAEPIRIKSPNVGSIIDLIEINNKLAVLTGSGMIILDKNTLFDEKITVVKKLTSANGLESGVTANGRAYYSSDNNSIYMNCQNGVYVYSLSTSLKDNAIPKLAITGVSVDNNNAMFGDVIKMGKYAKRIEIDLAVLTFLNRDNLTIYYQMEGVDKSPMKLDYERTSYIEYMNLKGGKYTLRMYAENSEGTKSNEVVLTIDKTVKWIEKPINQVFVAIVGIVIVGGIVFLILLGKMKKERAKAKWSKQVAEESVVAIANAIDAKDAYTNGHSIRVARISQCIGKHLNMSENDLEYLYFIGLMHDVGKIGIPDGILNKPARLTNEEYQIMQTHTEIGYSILKSIHSIPHLEDGVLCHHEKIDGSGYPHHLSNSEIPLTGRIIACADAYDAMATRRCYKEKMPNEAIIAEFERGSGKHFDPKLVSIVIECIKNGEFDAIVMKWFKDNKPSESN